MLPSQVAFLFETIAYLIKTPPSLLIIQNICLQFDTFDEYLSGPALPNAWKFAQSGLNLAMDDESLQEMLEVAKNPNAFDAWIEWLQDRSDSYNIAEY